MAMSNYNGAIIGLDAQFANQGSFQQDIDRVERALYLGKELGKDQGKEQGNQSTNTLSEITLSDCQQAVARMASANQVNSSDIKLVLVTQNTVDQTSFEAASFETSADNILVVSSLAKALMQIDLLIAQNNLVALVGINLAEQLGQQLTAGDELAKLATISFDQTFNGYQSCYGIAALLFSSTDFAQVNNSYVYSWLKGFAVSEGSSDDDIQTTTQSALENAAVKPLDIGLIEVSALADNKHALKESTALILSYGHEEQLTTAITCARSVTGEGKGFSQVLGLLRTVIALQQRYIPAISDWQKPQESELEKWQVSNFYLPTESRPWYPHPDGSAHLAAYSCLAESGLAGENNYCHVILTENKAINSAEKHPSDDIRHNGFIASSDLQLVLITGNEQQALLTKLAAIEAELEIDQNSIKDIALSYFSVYESMVEKPTYTASLLCESKEELIKEIQLAKAGIASSFSPDNNNNEWRTPKGSYFSAMPVNTDANTDNVTFLYPGIGATYVGLGRDLFHLFPEIHQDVADLADDIGASLKDRLLNPRTIIRPDFKALKQLDLNLRGNLADIAEAGVGFACVFTKVFENVFNVKADYATGYSMGEVSMYAALGAWQQPGLMSSRLASSDTFNHRLCGELLTLREHWGLDDYANENTGDELIWETYTIKATLDDVITASEGEERVYCTIINTPDSLLLAGYPEDCLRVISKLGVRAMPLNMANAIHSAPANKEYDDMVELYTMDVMPRLKTKMYSSSCYLPVPQMSKAIAHSVAKCLCDRVDFPRLINTLYDKGARVFIEMGPGRSLCSWVDKILDFTVAPRVDSANKARVAVPVNAKGTSDELTYLRAIAKLVSHGVKLDLQTLFSGSIIVKNTKRTN